MTALLELSDTIEKQEEPSNVLIAKAVLELEEKVAMVSEKSSVTDQMIFDQLSSIKKTMNKRFDKVDERFDKMDERFDKMDERFDKMDERFGKMDSRFDALETKVDDNHSELVGMLKMMAKNRPIE